MSQQLEVTKKVVVEEEEALAQIRVLLAAAMRPRRRPLVCRKHYAQCRLPEGVAFCVYSSTMVEEKVAQAFPSQKVVKFSESEGIVHAIMNSQLPARRRRLGDDKNKRTRPQDRSEIRCCIFGEGQTVAGSDLARLLLRLGYQGLILSTAAVANDSINHFDLVVPPNLPAPDLHDRIVAAWAQKFGTASLLPERPPLNFNKKTKAEIVA